MGNSNVWNVNTSGNVNNNNPNNAYRLSPDYKVPENTKGVSQICRTTGISQGVRIPDRKVEQKPA